MILLIQIWYTIYIIWVAFFKKIYKNIFFSIVEILSELSILVFLVIGTMITFIGREGMSSSTSTNIQLVAIFLVLFSTILNLVYSSLIMAKSVINIKNLIKYNKLKKLITKQYMEKVKLDESNAELNVEDGNTKKMAQKNQQFNRKVSQKEEMDSKFVKNFKKRRVLVKKQRNVSKKRLKSRNKRKKN